MNGWWSSKQGQTEGEGGEGGVREATETEAQEEDLVLMTSATTATKLVTGKWENY